MVGSSWRSSNNLMSSLRFAFSFFFFFFPSTYFLLFFFFYMERNKEQHLAKTCAVFFKRRLEQTWFCGTLGNRSERLSSGKLWANINEAFKLEKEKKTHTHCSKRKKFEQLEGRRRSSEIVTFFTSKPPPPRWEAISWLVQSGSDSSAWWNQWQEEEKKPLWLGGRRQCEV